MKKLFDQAYDIAKQLVGFVALYIIGYTYMCYATIGNFVSKFLPKDKIEEKVREKNK